MKNPLHYKRLTVVLQAALLLIATGLADAHEVPTNVVVQTYIKPAGNTLSLLARVPLEAMRDVNFPEDRNGYLQISAAEEALRDAATIWIARELALFENGERLDEWQIAAVQVSLPSDRSFQDYDRALAHVTAPSLPDSANLYRDQALLDVLIQYPIESDTADFSIQSRLSRLGLQTTTVVRFQLPDAAERVFEFSGDPGVVDLDPRWHQAFFRFVWSGIEHILDGTDHLLFVICLLIPFRQIRPLIVIVTSFTAAHSITLIASAFGLVPNVLWFPPFIETLIAASIVYMAFENIVGTQWQKRWIIAFAFGLVHGFGFSFALSEIMQFAGGHLLTSLLAFNIGVEIGQLLVIAIAVPIINLLFRKVVAERIGTIVLSAVLLHSGWHWMSERMSELSAFTFSWPAMNAAFFIALFRWLMLAIVIGVVIWSLINIYRRFLSAEDRPLSQNSGTR